MSGQIENINEWIEKADHDLGSAKIIYLHLPDYFDTIAFHCQQAVEKYLKALLVSYGIDFLRSHDLIYLLELLSEKVEVEDSKFQKAFTLNGFGVQIRYPNKIIKLTKAEIETAIQIAEEFRMFSVLIIGTDSK
ncbi:MAG: HEPN domain-containing protein [Prolixibacteraceae bacterium]|jgi:HEPN domain-containing protein|nr:HEPN domain-containing protein [Prolixibacteraceae bacterium]MCX6220015.1 HEPN domain-containing protein [Bacteroidia bacterium]